MIGMTMIEYVAGMWVMIPGSMSDRKYMTIDAAPTVSMVRTDFHTSGQLIENRCDVESMLN